MDIAPGMLAVSTAGHDKGTLYIVVNIEGNIIYLADGIYKSVENPKKKNFKHIKVIKKIPDYLLEKVHKKKKLCNEEIKHALKLEKREYSGGF